MNFAIRIWHSIRFKMTVISAGVGVILLGAGVQAKNPCNDLLKNLYEARNRSTKVVESSLDFNEKAYQLYRILPKKFGESERNKIFAFLLYNSPRHDALDGLVTIYRTILGKQTVADTETIQKVCREENDNLKKAGDPLEFSIRQQPSLHELFKLFEIPNVESDAKLVNFEKRQIIESLKGQDSLSQQIIIRAALEDIFENKRPTTSSHAVITLVEASSELVKGIQPRNKMEAFQAKQARELSKGIGDLVNIDRLGFDKKLANDQMHKVVIKEVEGFNLSKRQLLLALKWVLYNKDLNPSHGTIWPLGIPAATSAVWYAIKFFNSTPFDPSSYYSVPNTILTSVIAGLGIKFIIRYAFVLREGVHPIEGQPKGTTDKYLEHETDQKIALILGKLDSKSKEVVSILDHSVSIPMAPAPVQQVPQPPTIQATNTSAAAAAAGSFNSIVNPSHGSEPLHPDTRTDHEESKQSVHMNEASLEEKIEIAKREVEKAKAPPIFQPTITEDLRNAGNRFSAYFKGVKGKVVERDHLIDNLAMALLMPKSVNVLIVSESGVAKTVLTKFVFSGILDENGQPSYFPIQMGKDTSIDDLMGTVRPSKLKDDLIVRAVENALPGKRLAFFDEYFRAPIYTRENLLEFQANGSVSLAGTTYTSNNILSVYASNMYPNQVFLRDGKEAKAEFDRMLFTFVIPPTFEADDNMIDLREINHDGVPPLFFKDIDNLKEFAKTIPLDRYFKSKLKLLVNRLREKVMIDEHQSEVDWRRRVQNGDIVLTSPEYNARVLSPRTEALGQQVLTRFATYDWLAAGAPEDHGPVVTDNQFARLQDLLIRISGSDEHLRRITRQYGEGSAEHHEFEVILKLRKNYQEILKKLEVQIDESPDMAKLNSFMWRLGVGMDGGPNGLPAYFPANLFSNSADVVQEFLKWREGLLQRVSTRPKIIEITPNDVGRDKALYLADLILNLLKNSRQ